MAFTIVAVFRYPLMTALTSAAALSQIGEFSFILAGLGVGLKLLPETGQDLILAGAILSILANPLLFFALDKARPWLEARERQASPQPTPTPQSPELPATSLREHAVLVGHGRVGSLVAEALKVREIPFLVIEERIETVARVRGEGVKVVSGTVGQDGVLEAVNLPEAQWLISAIPSPFEAIELIERAKKANPSIRIIARAHNDAEVKQLRKVGADYIVLGEREIAREIVSHIFGLSSSSDRMEGTVDDAFRRAQAEASTSIEQEGLAKTEGVG